MEAKTNTTENHNINNEIVEIKKNIVSDPDKSMKKELDEKKKIDEINNKEYLIEYYVEDQEIIKEYKELFSPIKKRLKYTFYYNVLLCSASLMYAKNLGFYMSKYMPKLNKSLLNLGLISSIHAIGFSALLLGGNLIILGINPKEFLRKYREIDDKIMKSDPLKDLTLQEFIDGVSSGFSKKS